MYFPDLERAEKGGFEKVGRRYRLGMRKEENCLQIAYSNTFLIGAIKMELFRHTNS